MDITLTSKPQTRRTQNTHATWLACVVVLLGSTFYLYEYFLRVMPTVIIASLTQDFHLQPSQLGHLLASFFYAYALMQIPAGLICDQIGAKKSLILAILLCALATLVFQSTYHTGLAFASRLVIGSASAVAFIAPLKLASQWFSEDKQAMITGLVQLMGCVGAVFAGPPIAQLVETFGWRDCLFVAGVLGLVLAVLYALVLGDSPQSKTIAPQKKVSLHHILHQTEKRLSVVLRLESSWAVGTVAFATWAPVAIFAESWGIPYLSQLQGIGTEQAAQQIMWAWIGMAIASPIAGWASNYYQRRKAPTIILLFVGLIASLGLIFITSPSYLLTCFLCFFIGCSACAQPVTFGMVFDYNHDDNLATAIALNNMLLISSCSILQPTVGFLLECLNTSVTHTSTQAYQIAFLVVPITITVGIVACCFWVKETYCQRTNSKTLNANKVKLAHEETPSPLVDLS